MYLLVANLLLFSSHVVNSQEQTEHRDFQYNSVVDPLTGRYTFAYDTGNDNDVAHNLHMQYRDANGIVRGRYGYTDPRGKLRVVEYEAGPNGFVARGDTGPDLAPHDQTPETQKPQFARYSQEDLELVPRPIQMAGWDPLENPMGEPVSTVSTDSSVDRETGFEIGSDPESVIPDGYFTMNNTNSDRTVDNAPSLDPYDERYPRLSISTSENRSGRESEALTAQGNGDANNSEMIREVYAESGPLTVNNIDVNPNDIRVAAKLQPVRRSADGNTSGYSRTLPYSYRNYLRQAHDHDSEMVSQGTGYRVVYRPAHDHYHERYYRRPTHDHDSERRYVSSRQTHDHDAERYYLRYRQTHDHDAEKRQAHDHGAHSRYVSNRQTHDHDAERANYYRNIYYRNNYPYRRRIYYRDSHSMVPHEHYSDIYRNDQSHQHSDVHLYGRSQNLVVPATARPRQLKYVPADRYHDKYYYWTD